MSEKKEGPYDAHVSDSPSYARISPFRSSIRSFLLPLITWESHLIASLQRRLRSPFLDAYFVYTSSLGTHTFFMILLPAMFFFGFKEVGMGLVFVMGLGVYGSSWMKDFVCSPRPLAPPVTRLTLGNHHLEYGFPSTHSTNSVSIALFFWGYLHTSSLSPFSASPSESILPYFSCSLILFVYAFSIVFGRIYTAMHSFTDCAVGVLLGALIWVGVRGMGYWGCRQFCFRQARGSNSLSAWPPIILTAVFLTLVNQHPQPVDDCPCFEDALAMGAVVYGALLGKWGFVYFGMDGLIEKVGGPRPMIGSGWVLAPPAGLSANTTLPFNVPTWVASSTSSPLWQILLFTLTAAAKLFLGIMLIFAWRLLAKTVLGFVLPRVFRLIASAVGGFEWLGMPNRRFYLPATEYQRRCTKRTSTPPIPSVIDLPGSLTVGVEDQGGIGSGVKNRSKPLENGTNGTNGSWGVNGDVGDGEKQTNVKQRKNYMHYDADVLTKVIVYAGIAILSIEITPLVFELLGWGVYVWPPEGVRVLGV
ncbi:hypothetical protein BT96DRAFT_809540 [Gymnopus androsaceus JB14]|uniref:Phosphatidic acid phosphatase type 2/haloperoxidase domain-containing protein n=1 Tax=Gymnopus androsaceus JB14 TaxID=1447944 RepID=A0A6A4IAG4_9AGAR|nr:hypothetical protein BT96DRAFT_809540 [Gymnopus androsaceus JB14]